VNAPPPPTSLRARLLRPVLMRIVRPVLNRPWPPERRRRALDLTARITTHPPRGTRFEGDRIARPGLWVAAGPFGDGMVLWFHGGAYIVGRPRTHRAMAGWLARAAGVRVFLPSYRLAPEHPAPAGFEDALAVWDGLIGRGHAPDRVVLGGDSAGGGLALALLSALCRRGTPPAGLVAFSPWTDLTVSAPSIGANARSDQLLPIGRMAEVVDMVLGPGGGIGARDPRISPRFATFPDPPPVLITAAATEMLRDDALGMAGPLPSARIAVAGDLPHAWPYMHGALPEAHATLAEAGAFIRQCLSAAPAGS